MLPLHRAAIALVALAAVLAAAWLLLFAVPALIDRHRDGALLVALILIVTVPAGLAWGAGRLRSLLAPEDDFDD